MSRRSKGALSAMAAQLRTAAAVAELERGRDSAFATTLDIPNTYTSWVVYSEMKARWRCWRPDASGDTLVRAHNSGLWSVHSWNCLPLRRERKCLILYLRRRRAAPC